MLDPSSLTEKGLRISATEASPDSQHMQSVRVRKFAVDPHPLRRRSLLRASPQPVDINRSYRPVAPDPGIGLAEALQEFSVGVPEWKVWEMQIQVNTDNHTAGSAELTQQVEAVIEGSLGRFGDRITRVEVHLTDESGSQKSRENDKRCVVEARLAGLQPITVSDEGSSIEQALAGAAGKLEKTLKRTLGRLDDPKGRPSYAGEQPSMTVHE